MLASLALLRAANAETHDAASSPALPTQDTAPKPHSAMTDSARVEVTGAIAFLAGSYTSPLYVGDYQAARASIDVSIGRLGLGGSLPVFRLRRNGEPIQGAGDVMVHAYGIVFARDRITIGAMAMAMLPSGNSDRGLGMGHIMLMPEAWTTWTSSAIEVTTSVGLGYGLGAGAGAHEEHGGGGPWPLVDPMNAFELTYGVTSMVEVAPRLAVGLRAQGGVPLDDGGSRLGSGATVSWRTSRVAMSAELLYGAMGDPYLVRGTVQFGFRFR